MTMAMYCEVHCAVAILSLIQSEVSAYDVSNNQNVLFVLFFKYEWLLLDSKTMAASYGELDYCRHF